MRIEVNAEAASVANPVIDRPRNVSIDLWQPELSLALDVENSRPNEPECLELWQRGKMVASKDLAAAEHSRWMVPLDRLDREEPIILRPDRQEHPGILVRRIGLSGRH
jgi:hypothetical protein